LVSYEIVRRWVNHFDGREPLESEEPMPSLIVSSPIRGYRDMHLGGHSACTEGPLGSIMDLDEQARRLRMHVEQLAGKIGERNVFCPASLHATASYIEHEWEQQGYAVERLAYDVSGVRCLARVHAQLRYLVTRLGFGKANGREERSSNPPQPENGGSPGTFCYTSLDLIQRPWETSVSTRPSTDLQRIVDCVAAARQDFPELD
jgi:hypothetical protein